jgi:hypothetical protein
VAGVPFVIANVLDEFRVGLQIEFHEYGPRLPVSLGIVNRHRNIHVPEVTAGESFDLYADPASADSL